VSTGARSFFLGKLSFLCSIRTLYWFNCSFYSYWDITCFLKKIRFFFIFFLFPASFSHAFLCQTSFIYIQIYSKFSAEFEYLVEDYITSILDHLGPFLWKIDILVFRFLTIKSMCIYNFYFIFQKNVADLMLYQSSILTWSIDA